LQVVVEEEEAFHQEQMRVVETVAQEVPVQTRLLLELELRTKEPMVSPVLLYTEAGPVEQERVLALLK
jgi:hypothetical protein